MENNTQTENKQEQEQEQKEVKNKRTRGKKEQTDQQTDQNQLSEWASLTQEQQETLKKSLLKSGYGVGGEHFSTFPTLLDSINNPTNPFTEKHYPKSKLPKRVQETTFKTWEQNGTLQILPLLKSDKIHYLIIILPNKNIKMDLWELEKEQQKPYSKYITHNLIGEITLTNNHFHILNSYTNKNKAYNQSNLLVKLFQLGTTPKILEQQKDLNTNYLQLDIMDGKYILREISKNTHKPTGKIFKDIGEYLGRKQHSKINFNYLENIN